MPESSQSHSAADAVPAHYVMIGGFLGAGKTTSVARLAKHWHDRGRRVGLITNDQGSQLVDTAMLRAKGFATEEIAGGCFCCRFQSLTEAASNLTSSMRPDVFIAEPVGSCTDLLATVSYPLRRIYGDRYTIAPLSVVVDPIRARRLLRLDPGGRFSDKVNYIYRKQLEEADLIVVNKCDLLGAEARAELAETLARTFCAAQVLEVSAREGTGLEAWFELLERGQGRQRAAMEIDYAVYGEGEALLGWLNATLALHAREDFDGNELLREWASFLQRRLTAANAEVAHLKMTLEPEESLGDLAVINLVRSDFVPELSQNLEDPLAHGRLIVNLRAEADPEVLLQALEESVSWLRESRVGLTVRMEHQEHFKPAPPQPTHRDA